MNVCFSQKWIKTGGRLHFSFLFVFCFTLHSTLHHCHRTQTDNHENQTNRIFPNEFFTAVSAGEGSMERGKGTVNRKREGVWRCNFLSPGLFLSFRWQCSRDIPLRREDMVSKEVVGGKECLTDWRRSLKRRESAKGRGTDRLGSCVLPVFCIDTQLFHFSLPFGVFLGFISCGLCLNWHHG